MNNFTRPILLFVLLALACIPVKSQVKTPVTSGRHEEFFLVSSVYTQKSEILLKRPTEVTVVMKVSDGARCEDEKGNALKFSDLRAGDTVWITYGHVNGNSVISRIRKGRMTVETLHRLYTKDQQP
jgi:hypothetical protein